MKKITIKTLFIIAFATIALGGLIFAISIATAEGGIRGLSSAKTETKLYTEKQGNEITSVAIDFDTSDVEVVLGDVFSVSYPEKYKRSGKALTEVSVRDAGGVLSLSERTVGVNIGFDFTGRDSRVIVTVPNGRAINIKIETDTGDIRIDGSNEGFGKIDIESDTGDLYVTELSADSLEVTSDTGDIELRGLRITGPIDIESDTADVEISDVLCDTLKADTDTGDVSCDDAYIDAQKIYISTDTGDIELSLAGQSSDYTASVRTGTGKSNISSFTGGSRTLDIKTSTGDVAVNFEN